MRSVSSLYPYMIQFSQHFRILAVIVLQLYPTIRRHNPSHKVRRFPQKPEVFVTNYVYIVIVNCQLSIVNCQLSIVSCQL